MEIWSISDIVVLHKVIVAFFTLLNEAPTAHEKRKEKRCKRE
jgi:hypothetical protein